MTERHKDMSALLTPLFAHHLKQSCDCLINLTEAYSHPAQANENGVSFIPFSLPSRDDFILFPILRDLAEE